MLKNKYSQEPHVKPLSAETLAEVHRIFTLADNSAVLTRKNRFEITAHDILTLLPGRWLNDQIIDFYLSLVCDRANARNKTLRVFAFNSFFYKILSSSGPKQVERWTRKAKINGDNFLRLDFLIIPVNLDNQHWTVGFINFIKKRIEYYDSLSTVDLRTEPFYVVRLLKDNYSTSAYSVKQAVRNYMKNELSDKIDLAEWTNFKVEEKVSFI